MALEARLEQEKSSRRDFLLKIGLASLTLGLLNSQEVNNNQTLSQQVNPDDYRITYEKWIKSCKLYRASIRATLSGKAPKEEEILKQLSETELATTAARICQNPRAAYYSLTLEERQEMAQTMRAYREETTKRINPFGNSPNPVSILGEGAIGLAFLPLYMLGAPNADRFKKMYGREIPCNDPNPSLAYQIIIFSDIKQKKKWDDELRLQWDKTKSGLQKK